MKFSLALLAAAASIGVASADVLLATFNKTSTPTTFKWRVIDDPVMGGESHSNLNIDSSAGVASWAGQVKIVPFLKSPGGCAEREGMGGGGRGGEGRRRRKNRNSPPNPPRFLHRPLGPVGDELPQR